MTDKHYLQFPLAALSMKLPYGELVQHIFSYSVVELVGKKASDSNKAERVASEFFSAFASVSKKPEDLKKVVGGTLFSARAFDLDSIKKEHAAVTEHAERFNSGANGPLVRINAKNYKRILKHKSLNEREFRVLCAIYSALGSQKMRRITKEELQQRALGYPSPKRDLQKEHWMTDHELRKTRNALYKLRFFSMLTYGRRQTYYSNRLTEQDLHSQIFRSKTESAKKLSENRRASDRLTQQVRAEKLRLIKAPILQAEPPKSAQKLPRGSQSDAK